MTNIKPEETAPLLSICIPTFNRAQTLKSSLYMVCSQIEQQQAVIDVVICDNASTDETRQIVQELKVKWPFIKYFRNSENIGLLRNIDRVVRCATGRLCWLLGDDDIIVPYALEKIVNSIQQIKNLDDFAFGCTNSFVVDPDGERFLHISDLHCHLKTQLLDRAGELFKHLDYHSVGHISRLIVSRRAWFEQDYEDRRNFEIFSFVRVLIRMSKGRTGFYIAAPIVGGRNKHSVAYYANHIPMALTIEFPEYDRLCQIELDLTVQEMLPMMRSRRNRTIRGALKMLLFQHEYAPYLSYLRAGKFSLLSERITIFLLCFVLLGKPWANWPRKFIEGRQSNPISKDESLHKSI